MTAPLTAPPSRPLPALTPENEFHWTAGRDGVLRVQRSRPCGALLFPPLPICPYCGSTEIDVVEVSGRGTVVGCTVNAHQWLPAMPPPYSIAIVALEEDDRVRLTTNVVGCPPDDVHPGMKVEVQFEQQGDVWLPLFTPTGDREPGPLPAEDETKYRVRPMASPDKFEDKVAITGVGHVAARPAVDARSVVAHRRGVRSGNRRRRAPARGHRRDVDVPGRSGSREVTRRAAPRRSSTRCACARRGSTVGSRRTGRRARS